MQGSRKLSNWADSVRKMNTIPSRKTAPSAALACFSWREVPL